MLMKRWDRFTDEQKFQFVETIHHDAERMSRIVSEVLDLARLESGRLELHRTQADLLPIASRAGASVAILPGSDRIHIEIDDEVSVFADPERLEGVLANLLENAVKFSEDGPIVLSATSGEERVTIAVSDEGVGIPTERIGGVFEGPQPAGAMAMPTGGGLGLYLARGIVEAHGGTIEVESTEGKGTTFTMLVAARGEQ